MQRRSSQQRSSHEPPPQRPFQHQRPFHSQSISQAPPTGTPLTLSRLVSVELDAGKLGAASTAVHCPSALCTTAEAQLQLCGCCHRGTAGQRRGALLATARRCRETGRRREGRRGSCGRRRCAPRDTHVGHELLADGADLLRQRRGEHHDLLVVRRHLEDVLHVSPHVCTNEKRHHQDGHCPMEWQSSRHHARAHWQPPKAQKLYWIKRSDACQLCGPRCAPSLSSILSHSSRMKCRTEPSFSLPSFASCANTQRHQFQCQVKCCYWPLQLQFQPANLKQGRRCTHRRARHPEQVL